MQSTPGKRSALANRCLFVGLLIVVHDFVIGIYYVVPCRTACCTAGLTRVRIKSARCSIRCLTLLLGLRLLVHFRGDGVELLRQFFCFILDFVNVVAFQRLGQFVLCCVYGSLFFIR